MSAPLPNALRMRFQELVEEGLSRRAAALRLKLSPATGATWAFSIRRTGRARAARQGRPRGKGKLDTYRSFFADIITQDGDITMPELASALLDATGVRTRTRLASSFANSAIRTKKSLVAAERRRTRARRQREGWSKHRMPARSTPPERVVFIYETSVKTNLTRLGGWAPRGDRLVMDAPFGSWERRRSSQG